MMAPDMVPPLIIVRDAEDADVPALTGIKGPTTEALHRDRLRDAQRTGFRYLVCLLDQELIGFVCLLMERPAAWTDADYRSSFPLIVDLEVKEAQRGHGYGSGFMHAIERMTACAGYSQLYLQVEPTHNPRAFAFYQRLGYHPLQADPYLSRWKFADSAGIIHRGEDWVVDMVKQIGG
jgi:GNAT superfamily N-acetyltransferase